MTGQRRRVNAGDVHFGTTLDEVNRLHPHIDVESLRWVPDPRPDLPCGPKLLVGVVRQIRHEDDWHRVAGRNLLLLVDHHARARQAGVKIVVEDVDALVGVDVELHPDVEKLDAVQSLHDRLVAREQGERLVVPVI
jgi:hypothetical protein